MNKGRRTLTIFFCKIKRKVTSNFQYVISIRHHMCNFIVPLRLPMLQTVFLLQTIYFKRLQIFTVLSVQPVRNAWQRQHHSHSRQAQTYRKKYMKGFISTITNILLENMVSLSIHKGGTSLNKKATVFPPEAKYPTIS